MVTGPTGHRKQPAQEANRAVSAPQPEQSNSPASFATTFGPNEWLVYEMYQQYLKDPNSVDPAWWDFFEDYQPSTADLAGSSGGGNGARPAGTDQQDTEQKPQQKPQPAAAAPKAEPKAEPRTEPRTEPKAEAKTEPKSDDAAAEPQAKALRGYAARVVTNMEASLGVPTATSVRSIPAKLLIDNRTVINNHLRRGRGGKVSFTHLIGYALVKALESMPAMNRNFTEVDGKPAVLEPDHVSLGLAIDLEREDGTRQLLVPSIKNCDGMDFAQFWSAYEDVIRKARNNKLTADDFAGTTISLTNPGTIGTVHSVPRLMAGQGTIIGVGSLEYPAEYQGAAEETLAQLAVSKVLTLTSTYDHRIIQGAESGEFLRRMHELLLGEGGFYDEIFRSMRIPYEPIRWAPDFSLEHEDQVGKPARVIELIHAYRVRGHLMADTNPLEFELRRHPDLDIVSHGLTLWDLDREFPTGGFGGKPLMRLRETLGVLRDSYCRTIGIEYMHIQDPEQRLVDPAARGEAAREAGPRRAAAHPRQAQPGRGLRDLPADEVHRAEALQPRGRGDAHPADGRDPVRRRARRHGRGRHRHGPPRPAQRAGQHRRQELRADLPGVRGQHRPEDRPRLR